MLGGFWSPIIQGIGKIIFSSIFFSFFFFFFFFFSYFVSRQVRGGGGRYMYVLVWEMYVYIYIILTIYLSHHTQLCIYLEIRTLDSKPNSQLRTNRMSVTDPARKKNYTTNLTFTCSIMWLKSRVLTVSLAVWMYGEESSKVSSVTNEEAFDISGLLEAAIYYEIGGEYSRKPAEVAEALRESQLSSNFFFPPTVTRTNQTHWSLHPYPQTSVITGSLV